MLFEIIIVLEIIAFAFLALGIMPHNSQTGIDGTTKKAPYLNKIIFTVVGGIVFWALSLLTVSYDYNHCWVNVTTSNFVTNTTTATATCASYSIESLDLAYLNMGMGVLAIVLLIVITLFAAMSRHDGSNDDEYPY